MVLHDSGPGKLTYLEALVRAAWFVEVELGGLKEGLCSAYGPRVQGASTVMPSRFWQHCVSSGVVEENTSHG